jgi:hypothetical protein
MKIEEVKEKLTILEEIKNVLPQFSSQEQESFIIFIGVSKDSVKIITGQIDEADNRNINKEEKIYNTKDFQEDQLSKLKQYREIFYMIKESFRSKNRHIFLSCIVSYNSNENKIRYVQLDVTQNEKTLLRQGYNKIEGYSIKEDFITSNNFK